MIMENSSYRSKGKRNNGLNSKQIQLAQLILQTNKTLTQEQMGVAIGVSRITIGKWLKQPKFQEYVKFITDQMEQASSDYILNVYMDMVSDMYKLFKQPSTPVSEKRQILDLYNKMLGTYKQKVEVSNNKTIDGFEKWLNSDDEVIETLIEESNGNASFPLHTPIGPEESVLAETATFSLKTSGMCAFRDETARTKNIGDTYDSGAENLDQEEPKMSPSSVPFATQDEASSVAAEGETFDES